VCLGDIWERLFQMGRPMLSRLPGVSETFPRLCSENKKKKEKKSMKPFKSSSKSQITRISDWEAECTCNDDRKEKWLTSLAWSTGLYLLPVMAVDHWRTLLQFPLGTCHHRIAGSRMSHKRSCLLRNDQLKIVLYGVRGSGFYIQSEGNELVDVDRIGLQI